MDYEDFVLQLGNNDLGPTVRVARSPTGESDPEALLLLWDESERVGFASAFSRSSEAQRQGRDLSQSEIAGPSIAEAGARFYRALFPEGVRNLYQQSLGRVRERGHGLRLRIEMGLVTAGAAKLHAIPWEYLASDGQFLSLSREISIVRHLALGLPGERPPVPPPLSVLVVPGGDLAGGELDLAEERRQLEQAWSESGNVRIHVLPDPTLDTLREELLAREYHVLHFMGHGGFSAETGEGTLAFRARDGKRVWISGTELAEQLHDRPSLRLIFLNACRTAQAGAGAPYLGVATALLRAGVPAVLGMQFPISDPAALALSRAFYRRIARGDTIDAAVTEGRKAIRRLSQGNTEWGTPVLFERLASGRLVEPANASPPPGRLWPRFRVIATAAALGSVLILVLLMGWTSFQPVREDAKTARVPKEAKTQPIHTSGVERPDPPNDAEGPSGRKTGVLTHRDVTYTPLSPGPRPAPKPQKTCSTWHNDFSSQDSWTETSSGSGVGIVDAMLKITINRPDWIEKRCLDCRTSASTYKISATIRPDGKATSWGLYFLDMSEVQGEWFYFEIDREGRASIKRYRDGRDIAILWAGTYTPREKNRLTVEAGDGRITASVDGAPLGQASYDPNLVPKVPLGVGFFLFAGSDVPTTAWFDDYEFTACFPSVAE
jgi:hypothetical protein